MNKLSGPSKSAKQATDESVKLRHEVYRCGALFHRALTEYFTALNEDAAATVIADITGAVREAGEVYNAALVALLKHLKSLPGNAEISAEVERAERTISILSFEIRRL